MKKKIIKARNFARRHEKKIRYLFVGAWNTLFRYVCFVFLYHAGDWMRRHYLVALLISQFFGIANAYLGYKHFVFKTKGGYMREYFRFSGVYWIIFIFNFFALPFLVHKTSLGPVMAQAVLLPITVVLSYVVHNRFSFKTA